MGTKAVCIIPARGGSKRIPKKNIRDFLGKPLIAYSIETALASGLFEKVVVSTDDEAIAKIARAYGADVPFVRPENLSDDFTGSGDVVQHALAFLEARGEKYGFLCTIYATAPLLQTEFLIEGLKKLQENPDAHMALSVTSMPFPIQRTFKITKENRCEMFTPQYFSARSQDLEEAYQDAGQFYWENLQNKATDIPFGQSSIPVILPRYFVQDIDTLEDWQRAEQLYLLNKNIQNNSEKKLKESIEITPSKRQRMANEG